jgi:hypothetical protein
MQNLDSCTKSSRRFIVSLRSQLRYLSQRDRWQKQQKEPCRAANIPADTRPEKPRNSGNSQHNERREPPAVIRRAGPPRTSQDEQRRNDRKEKKDVIEIHLVGCGNRRNSLKH